MRKRLYFVLPSLKEASAAVDDLLLSRIDERHIHVMAKEGVDLGDLPEASLLQKSDIVHSVEMGMIAGGLAGLAASAIIVLQLEVVMGLIVLGCTLFGAFFGVWVSGMIGSSVRNSRLKRFEDTLEQGNFLLMVDVRLDKVEAVNAKMKGRKEVVFGGEEVSMPAFP